MAVPSTRELLQRLQKIEEHESKKGQKLNEDSGPAETAIQKGEEQKIISKDDNSGQVKMDHGEGSPEAPKSYDGNNKSVNTDVKNERKEGSDEAEEEFTGNEKPVSDNFKMDKGSNKTVASAEGADKDFASYRQKIRAAMRGGLVKPIDKPEFQGNKGLNK